MCLSIPSKVVELDRENNSALVDTMGVKRRVSLDLLTEEVNLDDYVLIHIGFAIGKIDEEDAMESLKLYDEIIEHMHNEDERENGS